jgi:Right handed beta helix region
MANTYRGIASLLTLSCVLTCGHAEAAQRAFVASTGSDANTASNCSLTLPCRGFAAAATVTDNNGEIIVLDSAGYGPVTIAKSISIIAPAGVYAGISVFSGNGITINTAGINVVLRGLAINGQGGDVGVYMTAGSRLTVENCVVANLASTGIFVNALATVRISDTTIRDTPNGLSFFNGARATVTRAIVSGSSNVGLSAYGTLGDITTTADIADSSFGGNHFGVSADASVANAVVRVSVRDSRIAQNTASGMIASAAVGAIGTLTASNNLISNSIYGITGTGGRVWLSGNTVSDNGIGLYNAGVGVFESAGDNAVRNNQTNTAGTITVIATK